MTDEEPDAEESQELRAERDTLAAALAEVRDAGRGVLETAAQEVDAIHRDEVAEHGVGRGASYAEIGTWLRARAAAERGGR